MKNTKLKEAFYLFCAEDNGRELFLNPFVVGDKTYATNSYIIIGCDTNKIDFEYENLSTEKHLIIENIIPDTNMNKIIDVDSIDWDSFMTSDELIAESSDVICGHCYGDGVYTDSFVYKNKSYDYEYECPVCHGTGYEELEKMVPTGNKTFTPGTLVSINDTAYISLTNFHMLKKVKDLVGGDVEIASLTQKNKPILFKIGFLDILIMPVASEYPNVILSI